MGYLEFDKSQLVNTEYSLQKEYIRTNRAGSFASSTIINCNTRKHHGLLICPIKKFNNENHVLLSSLDETIIKKGVIFNLAIHKFPGCYFPKGHKYLYEFHNKPIPSLIYKIGDVLLKKDFLLVENEEGILIRYTLLESNSPVTLRLQAFLAFRNIHKLTKANLDANTRSYPIEGGIKMKLYKGFPYLNMQTSKKSEYVHAPDWYLNFQYEEEKIKGKESCEDLLNPGYFERKLKAGESIIFSASTKECSSKQLTKIFNNELKKRTERDSFDHCLENSAQQFLSFKKNNNTIINGFPCFSKSERNTYLALPGLCLARNDVESFKKILDTSIANIFNRFSTNEKIHQNNKAIDSPLWLFWSLQNLEKWGESKSSIWKNYGSTLKKVLNLYTNNNRLAVKQHQNSLLWNWEKACSWMNKEHEGQALCKREGFLVEINALWYNAICFSLDLAKESGDVSFTKKWKDTPKEIENSFALVFWNEEKQYLADYVSQEGANWDVRPNQLFACSLPYSCINKKQKKAILARIKDELLTPKGLRTLSPKNKNYKGHYTGNEEQRKDAFHNGSAFPWLFGHFAQAYLDNFGSQGIELISSYLKGFETCIENHGIGSISELFDGNPPHKANEAISYALNVAEIIRINYLLDIYRSHHKYESDFAK